MKREAKPVTAPIGSEAYASHLHLTSVPPTAPPVHGADSPSEVKRNGEIRPWLRPLLSLRAQLTISCCIIVCFAATLLFVVFNADFTPSLLFLAIVLVIALSTLLAFGLISILLRPLLQVTDAAQALALGDLKQRTRLPVRYPPQDEIDRLAGSLDEMVSRLERADELRNSSEQSFRRFFTDASHQLRTPLTSLRGFTEVLMRGGKDDPETMQRVLKRMKSEAERMTLLINDLLTVARLDDTRLFKTQYLNLTELVTERIAYTKAQAKDDRNITLVTHVQQELDVQGDKERLKQLFLILLDNAFKYGYQAPEGHITLQIDKQNGHAIIRVIDDGEGIAPEDMDHIFEAFYRGKYRHSTQGVIGAGLGLTIAQRIVHMHKGNITATSKPNEETIFTITLPCTN